MIILGIETSCDETSVAILKDDEILANLVASQDFHTKYGGVVPELSSRAHLQMIAPLVKQAIEKADISLSDLDFISATAGPGLIGALLVGFTFAKGLSYSLGKPFIPVNHIEGHIFSGFLMPEKPEFPLLVLAVSGGHTFLFLAESFTKIRKIGATVDDAAGEAFDKVSKMIGLGYPGGPRIQKAAESGDPEKFDFPVSELENKYNFSFSGIKTSVLRHLQTHFKNHKNIPEEAHPDIAASFQNAVIKALISKSERVITDFEVNSLSLVGGVAANRPLREAFIALGEKHNKKVVVPAMQYCGDNGAMIAYRAKTLIEAGETFTLDYDAFPAFQSKYVFE